MRDKQTTSQADRPSQSSISQCQPNYNITTQSSLSHKELQSQFSKHIQTDMTYAHQTGMTCSLTDMTCNVQTDMNYNNITDMTRNIPSLCDCKRGVGGRGC